MISSNTLSNTAKIIRRCIHSRTTSFGGNFSSSHISRRNLSSTNGKKDLPPPLPPRAGQKGTELDPRQAKQEYLKAKSKITEEDPIAKMAQLQKELDIVREKAAENLEKKLQKSVYRRLTDPLRRHHHSMINVGAVLLAYILAHYQYQAAKRAEKAELALEKASAEAKMYQDAIMDLLQETTLESIATKCTEWDGEDTSDFKDATKWRSSLFSGSNSTTHQGSRPISKGHIFATLQRELNQRLEEHVLSDEDKRIRSMQRAWQDSQGETTSEDLSSEKALLVAVLKDDSRALHEVDSLNQGSELKGNKKQKRIFSM